MLKYAMVFLVVGLMAGLLGFTELAAIADVVARFLFFLAMGIFLVLLTLGLRTRERVEPDPFL